MGPRVFWDVDTQVDFMRPTGKLYVGGAEGIEDNLAKLTQFARYSGIRLLGSVDYHEPSDSEISEQPDFHETYPPHCLRGTPGQAKVPATAPLNPLWIDAEFQNVDDLIGRVMSHNGEVIFRKQRFDVFSNPNVDPVLNALDPVELVVYGVALDVCNRHAIEGFLARGRKVTLVTDATRAINPGRGDALIDDWQSRGVKIANASALVGEP